MRKANPIISALFRGTPGAVANLKICSLGMRKVPLTKRRAARLRRTPAVLRSRKNPLGGLCASVLEWPEARKIRTTSADDRRGRRHGDDDGPADLSTGPLQKARGPDLAWTARRTVRSEE